MYDLKQERFFNLNLVSLNDFLCVKHCDGLYHIKQNDVIDILIRNFTAESLAKKKILVCFSGAIDNRENKVGPFFSGMEIAKKLGLPLVSFADPLVSSNDLNLAWYTGKDKNFQNNVIYILRELSKIYEAELIFFGGSGGGFASLYYSSQVQLACKCLVWNPQVNILKYHSTAVRKYLETIFSEIIIGDNFSDAEVLMRKRGIVYDVSNLDYQKVDLLYLHNLDDYFHLENHANDFFKNRSIVKLKNSLVFGDKGNFLVGNFGRGHAAPNRDVVENALRHLAFNENVSLNDIVNCNMDYYFNLVLNKNEFYFSPKITYKSGYISVELNLNSMDGRNIIGKNIKFACYLENEKQVIKKMYQKSNIFNFKYSDVFDKRLPLIIRCYAIDNNGNTIFNNFKVPDYILNKVKVFILGSCVSRDSFSVDDLNTKFEIINYIARTSLARVTFPKIKNIQLDISLESKFQKRLVNSDLLNSLLDTVKASHFDYMILDFIDERFGLIEFDSTFVTNSFEFQNAKLVDQSNSKKLDVDTLEFLHKWEKGFCKILEHVSPSKIIINDVQWAYKTDDSQYTFEIDRIYKGMLLMNNLYRIAQKYIPAENFIQYPSNIFLAKTDHKWGVAPYHYQDKVYQYFMQRLKEIILINPNRE